MMGTKSVFAVLLLGTMLLFSARSVAQNSIEDEPAGKMKHAIGAGAGFTTGYGLSYRYTPGRFGVQVNFAPYHDKETSRYSIGVTPLYTLIQNKTSNLYLYQGNHYYYNSEMMYVYDPGSPSPGSLVKSRSKENYFNNGVGIGVEFVLLKRIGFNLMAGYAAYKNFEELNVTGETALYYKF